MLTSALFFRHHHPPLPLLQKLQQWLLFIGQQRVLLLQHLLFHAHSILRRDYALPPALMPRPSPTVLFRTASHPTCSPLCPWPSPCLPHPQHLLISSNTLHSPSPAPRSQPHHPRNQASRRVFSPRVRETESHSGQEGSPRLAGTWASLFLFISPALETVRVLHKQVLRKFLLNE